MACHKNQDKQGKPRSECFWTSSHIRVIPICFPCKHIIRSTLIACNFLRTEWEKCLNSPPPSLPTHSHLLRGRSMLFLVQILTMSALTCTLSPEGIDGFYPNLHWHIICVLDFFCTLSPEGLTDFDRTCTDTSFSGGKNFIESLFLRSSKVLDKIEILVSA